MYYVYIFKSAKDRKLYIGSTDYLRARLKKHNDGKVPSTKPRRPFTLRYYEAYSAEADARKREKNLKLYSRAYTQLKKRIVRSIA